jgi:hypothetical protein
LQATKQAVRCSGCVPWLVGGLPFSLVGLIVRSISAAGSRGQFAFELLEEFFTRLGDGFGPEVSFPLIMERGLWGESHGGAGASAKDDRWLFGFPAISAAVRSLVDGLVEVLGSLTDPDDWR